MNQPTPPTGQDGSGAPEASQEQVITEHTSDSSSSVDADITRRKFSDILDRAQERVAELEQHEGDLRDAYAIMREAFKQMDALIQKVDDLYQRRELQKALESISWHELHEVSYGSPKQSLMRHMNWDI